MMHSFHIGENNMARISVIGNTIFYNVKSVILMIILKQLMMSHR